jgi:peptide/nickel transport system ATP-binding protein
VNNETRATTAAPGAEAAAGSPPPGKLPLLEIRDLSVSYGAGPQAVHAVDRVSLAILAGEAIGIAGESGSGKSTLVHGISRLLRPPAAVTGGQVLYRREATGDQAVPEVIDILELSGEELRQFRWNEVAVVFQSAMSALNPVINIRSQICDAIRAHRSGMSRAALEERAVELLELVRVTRDRLDSYPHQLSGGMRQRVMIAMALALSPRLLVMDEPTTALDVVTQNQILVRIAELREQLGFAMVFITHDLSLLLEIADTIAIMYAGRIVEVAPRRVLHRAPSHPYTIGLLRSFPPLTGPRRELIGIPGSPPDLRSLPPGCPFAPRCDHTMDICRRQDPVLEGVGSEGNSPHLVACWLRSRDQGGQAAAVQPGDEPPGAQP